MNYEYIEVFDECYTIYKGKNKDYGNLGSEMFKEYGLTSTVIRLTEKVKRLKTLAKAKAEIKDGSIEDTLKDIVNYSVMILMELQKERG